MARKERENNHKHEFKDRREKIAWYLDEIDCYKEDMGRWYTLLIRRIIPLLVFVIPMNVISYRTYEFIVTKWIGGVVSGMSGTVGMIIWFVAMLIFLLFLIFTPRFATFLEFVLGSAFFVFVYRSFLQFEAGTVAKPIITNGLGYFVAIVLGIFLFMKLVFLVFEILYRIIFRGEEEPKAYKDDSNELVL